MVLIDFESTLMRVVVRPFRNAYLRVGNGRKKTLQRQS